MVTAPCPLQSVPRPGCTVSCCGAGMSPWAHLTTEWRPFPLPAAAAEAAGHSSKRLIKVDGLRPVTPPNTGPGGTSMGEAGRGRPESWGMPVWGPRAVWVQGEIVHRPRVRVEARWYGPGAMPARLGWGRCGVYGQEPIAPRPPAAGGTPALPWGASPSPALAARLLLGRPARFHACLPRDLTVALGSLPPATGRKLSCTGVCGLCPGPLRRDGFRAGSRSPAPARLPVPNPATDLCGALERGNLCRLLHPCFWSFLLHPRVPAPSFPGVRLCLTLSGQ